MCLSDFRILCGRSRVLFYLNEITNVLSFLRLGEPVDVDVLLNGTVSVDTT